MSIDSLYTTLNSQLVETLSGKYSAVISMVSGPLQIAMAINLVVVGFAVMRGISQEPFGAYLGTWLKCYLVILAATSSIAPQIAAAAQAFPDQLAAAVGGGAINISFDAFVDKALKAALDIHGQQEPWLDIPSIGIVIPQPYTLLMAAIIAGVGYIVAGLAMVMVIFAKFGLFITIALMPIFVGALIFPSSSGLFFSWLGAVLNYSVNIVAVTLALSVSNHIMNDISGSISGAGGGAIDAAAALGAGLAAQALILGMMVVAAFLVMQAASIASFAGGGGASGAGFLSALFPTTLKRAAIKKAFSSKKK